MSIMDRLQRFYLYICIIVNQNIDKFFQHRENVRWIRKNGPYEG